jgi:hypothetical protein
MPTLAPSSVRTARMGFIVQISSPGPSNSVQRSAPRTPLAMDAPVATADQLAFAALAQWRHPCAVRQLGVEQVLQRHVPLPLICVWAVTASIGITQVRARLDRAGQRMARRTRRFCAGPRYHQRCAARARERRSVGAAGCPAGHRQPAACIRLPKPAMPYLRAWAWPNVVPVTSGWRLAHSRAARALRPIDQDHVLHDDLLPAGYPSGIPAETSARPARTGYRLARNSPDCLLVIC